MGFLRLLTNKHVMQEEVMGPDGAWQAYRTLRLDRRIGCAAEPHELPETWREFTRGPRTSPNIWTDAYLCAFASAARWTLVTLDAKIPARPTQDKPDLPSKMRDLLARLNFPL